jgi:glutaredoxin-related protein
VRQHAGSSSDGDSYVDVVVMQAAFDVDAFTAWYQAQGGLANSAFKDFYGNSHTKAGEWVDNGEGSGTWSPSSTSFDNPNWQMTGFGGALAHSQLISLDLNNKPSLRDDAAVGFDLQAGWATAHGNIYKKQDWVEVAIPLIMVAAVSYFSAGTMGPAAASAMGMTATTATGAVALTATGVVVSAAIAGAATSLVSGLIYDNLSFKGVLIGALTGALSAGALQGLSAALPTVNMAAGTAAGFAANFTVQTGIQALIKGEITDQILVTSFASALGQTLAAKLEAGITDAKLQGAEAFAARGFAKVLTSAVKALGNPNDPNFGFASALVDSVVNGGLGALDAAAQQEGLEQRNQMDIQSDEAHDARAAQQSDEILARRGRELAGQDSLQKPPPPDPFATISDTDGLARSDLIADQLGVPRGDVSDVGLADYFAQSGKVLRGFVEGAGFSVLETGAALLEIAKSPGQFINGVQALLNSAEARAQLGGEIVNRVKVDIQMLKDAFNDGDLQRTGQQLGKLTADLAQIAGGVEALARLGVSTATTGGRFVLKAAQDVAVGRTATLAGPQVRSAELVNRAMIGASKEPAWLAGTQVVTEIVPEGTRYYMVVDAAQAANIRRGVPDFGKWATPEPVPSQAFARGNLAIIPEFKADVSFVVIVETTSNQIISRGLAGPVGQAAGTGAQVQFAEFGQLKIIGKPQPLPNGP